LIAATTSRFGFALRALADQSDAHGASVRVATADDEHGVVVRWFGSAQWVLAARVSSP